MYLLCLNGNTNFFTCLLRSLLRTSKQTNLQFFTTYNKTNVIMNNRKKARVSNKESIPSRSKTKKKMIRHKNTNTN